MGKDLFSDLDTNIEDRYKRRNYQATLEEIVAEIEDEIDGLNKIKHDIAWANSVKEVYDEVMADTKLVSLVKNLPLLQGFVVEADKIIEEERIRRLEQAKREAEEARQKALKEHAKQVDDKIKMLEGAERDSFWCGAIEDLESMVKALDAEVKALCTRLNVVSDLKREKEIVELAIKYDEEVRKYSAKENWDKTYCREVIAYVNSVSDKVQKYMKNKWLLEDLLDRAKFTIKKIEDQEEIDRLAKIKAIEEEEKKKQQQLLEQQRKDEANDIDSRISNLVNVKAKERDNYWCDSIDDIEDRISSLSKEVKALCKNLKQVQELKRDKEFVLLAIKADVEIVSYANVKLDKESSQEVLSYIDTINSKVKAFMKNSSLVDELSKNAKNTIKNIEKAEQDAIIKRAQEERESQLNALRERFRNCKQGKTVFFGSYVQDKREVEPIEWIVVEKTSYSVRLLSKKVLDACEYGNLQEVTNLIKKTFRMILRPDEIDKHVQVLQGIYNWENSYIRKWLNQEFLYEAFDELERDLISSENNKTSYGSVYAPSFQSTTEKVFLLEDCSFVKKKFLKAKATNYAISKHVCRDKKNVAQWWLRYANVYRPISSSAVYYGSYSSSVSYDRYPDVVNYFVDSRGKPCSHVSYTDNDCLFQDKISKEINLQKCVGVRPSIVIKL